MTIAHQSKGFLIDSSERLELTSASSTDVPATPTSCVELLKEVAEGAVAGLLDDDDSSFNSQQSLPDTPPAFLMGGGWPSNPSSTVNTPEISPPRSTAMFGLGRQHPELGTLNDVQMHSLFASLGFGHQSNALSAQTSVMLR